MNNFWEQRWQNQQTGWDLGAPSPPLIEYLQQIPNEKRTTLRVLIPGCGNGHEAFWMVRHGFQYVTLLDIAPTAVKIMEQRIQAELQGNSIQPKVICGDFFDHQEQYDLILEQTFFCALLPELRDAYVVQMSKLLRSGGKLVGLLFDRSFEGGPPFGGSKEVYEQQFSTHFTVQKMEKCHNSISPRAGSEVFFIAGRTTTPFAGV